MSRVDAPGSASPHPSPLVTQTRSRRPASYGRPAAVSPNTAARAPRWEQSQEEMYDRYLRTPGTPDPTDRVEEPTDAAVRT